MFRLVLWYGNPSSVKINVFSRNYHTCVEVFVSHWQWFRWNRSSSSAKRKVDTTSHCNISLHLHTDDKIYHRLAAWFDQQRIHWHDCLWPWIMSHRYHLWDCRLIESNLFDITQRKLKERVTGEWSFENILNDELMRVYIWNLFTWDKHSLLKCPWISMWKRWME